MPDVRESSRRVVARIEAATPPGRDRAVDALRALAILGVVGGHWLVTALVADSGTVRGASPLVYLPHLTPVSWVFQTLAVFFLVGGMVAAGSWASARKRGVPYGQWIGARLARLFRPVAAVLVVWTLAAGAMLVSGVGEPTVLALAKLVWSPLWFLLVFAALTALTPWWRGSTRCGRSPWCSMSTSYASASAGPASSGGSTWSRAGWCRTAWGRWSRGADCAAGGTAGPCCSGEPRRPSHSCCGRAIRPPWSAFRAAGSPTWTHRASPPSPSAWRSAGRPCCCSGPCAGRCAGPPRGRRWRW